MLALLLPAALAGPALQPSPLGDESYAETYTAVASFEDGSFVLLQLLFTNAGFGDGRGGCRALWVPPGQAGINASENGGRGDWSYDAGADRLTVGPCHLGAAEGGLRFFAALEGLSVDMTLAGASPQQVRPPDGRVPVGDAFHESDLVVPWAQATATLSAGGDPVTLSGAAHLDHSRSNTLLPKVAACWMRFRGFFGPAPILLQARLPPGSGAPAGWSWPLSEAAPAAASAIAVDGGGEKPRLEVDGVTVEPSYQVYRYRPTEAYGALGKLAAPWIGDPTTTTWAAAAAVGEATVHGILEVSEIEAGGCAAR